MHNFLLLLLLFVVVLLLPLPHAWLCLLPGHCSATKATNAWLGRAACLQQPPAPHK